MKKILKNNRLYLFLAFILPTSTLNLLSATGIYIPPIAPTSETEITAPLFSASTSPSSITREVEVLEPQEFARRIARDRKAVIIDVRKKKEYDQGHLKNAILIDFLETPSFLEKTRELNKKKHYYLYCRSGRRSHAAAEHLHQQGYTVFDMKGGYLKWTSLQLPTVK